MSYPVSRLIFDLVWEGTGIEGFEGDRRHILPLWVRDDNLPQQEPPAETLVECFGFHWIFSWDPTGWLRGDEIIMLSWPLGDQIWGIGVPKISQRNPGLSLEP